MTPIVLVAHAPLASALRTVALHAFPDCAALLRVVDVSPEEEPDAAAARIRALVVDPPALVLVDVFGATPANAALLATEGSACRLVCGVNVPMLWRVLCYASESVEALSERAVEGAKQAVIRVAPPRRQNQSLKSVSDDPQHHHDQQ